MKPKQWNFNLILFFFIIYSITILIYYIVNPYQIFEYSITKKKFFYSQNEYPIKLFNKLKTKKYSLLFGTSRSQRVQTDGTNTPILNLASLYGNPLSVLDFLHQLNQKQIKNIDKIYYLVDDHCLNGYDTTDEHSHYKKINFHKSLKIYDLTNLLEINQDKIARIIDDIKYNFFKQNTYVLTENGAMNRVNDLEYYNVPDIYKTKSTRQYYEEDGLNALIEVNNFCIKNNLTISYYTPTHFDKYDKLMNPKIIYKKWSYLLDNGIDSFYALWYIDDISNLIKDNHYVAFSDKHSHMNNFYVHKVFIDNVVKDSRQYKVSNKKELILYLKKNQKYFLSKLKK